MNNKTKAHLALLGANLFYGAGFTIAKEVMPRLLQPLGFIFIRVSVVTVLFWSTYTLGKSFRSKIDRKDWRIIALAGLFGVALNQMLFFLGLNLTFPIHASLIMMSTPLLITLISVVILRDRITWDKYLGLFLGIGGAMLLMSAGKEITSTGSSALGDFFIFLNATSYAIYLVIVKPLMQRYRPLIVIRWVFLFGFIMILPFCWGPFMETKWELFRPADYVMVGFIVICVTFFTYLWNIYALRHLPPSTAGAYIYLQPIFAAIISITVTGEDFTLVKLAATLLTFAGVYLVNFGLYKRKPAKLTEHVEEK